VQTLTVAVLLHKRRMVSLASLDYAELGRCALAAVASGGVVWAGVYGFERLTGHLRFALLRDPRGLAAILLLSGSLVWLLVTGWVLEVSGSALPRVVKKRLRLA